MPCILQNSNVESLHYRIKSKLWWGYMNVPPAKLTLKTDYLPCVCVHASNSSVFVNVTGSSDTQERKPISVDFVIKKQRNGSNTNSNNSANITIITTRTETQKKMTSPKMTSLFSTPNDRPTEHNVNYNDIIPLEHNSLVHSTIFCIFDLFSSPFSFWIVFECVTEWTPRTIRTKIKHYNDEMTNLHTLNCTSFH